MIRTLLAVTLAGACLAAPMVQAQSRRSTPPPPPPTPYEVVPVQGSIYLIPGAGGNATLQIGDEGLLLVDTGLMENSERLLATIREFTTKPLRRIVNTHVHRDHTGGNAVLAAAGQDLKYLEEDTPGAGIYAHESVLHRMSGSLGEEEEYAPEALPLETYFTGVMEFYFNGESVQLLHQPNAHTDGDTIVYFRRSDVISTGDIYVTTTYPFIDVARGGSMQGILDALNRIIEIMIPNTNEEGGTLVVSGHGRISDEYEVVAYRDMLTIIRDRIVAMVEMGMNLEQVKAARPSFDYDQRYGLDAVFWSTERFIEAIYREYGGR